MEERALARELVRARLQDLAQMQKKVDTMRKSLDKLLAVQLEFQAAIEEDQERPVVIIDATCCPAWDEGGVGPQQRERGK
ncbi:hypothetical protein PI124_g5726 [Phytophthora idaei]|nr:hypothetical protein PI125_g20395 [Phytophthora idaei]KAG3135206.1 hypothetical protein PI126_g18351 [Phytophthora idaei]KAG3249632.1 hypothetical protein PI124_g5726 [Phytophthora idaei]